jgi:hypothetical protein
MRVRGRSFYEEQGNEMRDVTVSHIMRLAAGKVFGMEFTSASELVDVKSVSSRFRSKPTIFEI